MSQTIKDKLADLVESRDYYVLNGVPSRVVSWKVNKDTITLNCQKDDGPTRELTIEIDDYDMFFNEEKLYKSGLPDKNNLPAQTIDAALDTDTTIKSTFGTIKTDLIDDLAKIRNGEMKIDKAKAITGHVQTIVNITKLELEALKVVKKR